MNPCILKTEKIICENIFTKNINLDLSDLSLEDIPMEIYEANHLEGCYLSNNNLKLIPSKFFESFPKLKFLDLRFNKLTELPQEIGNLKSLQILLLDGNDIKSLPKDLSNLKGLKGLNIGSNPLVYPNVNVLKQGYKAILDYLKGEIENNPINFNNETSPNNKNDNTNEVENQVRTKSQEKLFKPKIYKEIHQSFLDKGKRANSFKQREIVTQSDKHNSLVNLFPEPVSLENIERKMVEQMRLEKIKEVKIKKEAELQRAKNKTAIREWQEEAKDLQSFKRSQQAKRMPLDIKFEADDRILKAPFKVEKEYLETITGEDLDIQKQSTIKPSPKPQPMDREMQLMLEAERRTRQKTIQSDIRKHSEYLTKKRNLPKGTAEEELESAKKDMEIAMKLQKQLQDNICVT